MEKRKFILVGIIIVLLLCGGFLIKYFCCQSQSFNVKGALIQLNLPLGEEASINNIKIINTEKNKQTFSLTLENLDEIASLEEREFILNPAEEKDIKVFFDESLNEVKTYIGRLVIRGDKGEEEIPIIVNIVDEKSSFSIIQSSLPQYQNAYPGGEFGVQIKVVDSASSASKSIDIVYSLMNFRGEVFEQTPSNIIVGDSWTKIISIPKDFEKGNYVLVTAIDYKGLKTSSAYKFSIGNKERAFFSKDLNFFVIIIFVIVLAGLILFFYFMRSRDDLLVQLKKQQGEELDRNLHFINQCRFKFGKIKDKKRKKQELERLRKTKEVIVTEIKKKQKKQRKSFKKLKRKNKKTDMEKKVSDWKKQGYKMQEASREMKLSKGDVNKKMDEWKRQGYKF